MAKNINLYAEDDEASHSIFVVRLGPIGFFLRLWSTEAADGRWPRCSAAFSSSRGELLRGRAQT